MKRDPKLFASVWNSSRTMGEAVVALGGTRGAVWQYAYYLRQKGVRLRDLTQSAVERPRISLPQLFYAAKETGVAAESPVPGESA